MPRKAPPCPKIRENRLVSCVVLVVEDEEPFASALELALLGIPGAAVMLASSGHQALELLKADQSGICALITDLNMPDPDGFELIKWARASQAYAQLPIIVLSGDTDPFTPERVYGVGADAYFSKPYSPLGVRQKLEQLLNAKTV